MELVCKIYHYVLLIQGKKHMCYPPFEFKWIRIGGGSGMFSTVEPIAGGSIATKRGEG